MNKEKRDFLTVWDLSTEEIRALFERAAELKKALHNGEKRSPTLQGRSFAMIFEKPSTRTRVSFAVGIWQLGGHVVYLSPQDAQFGRGEPIEDTARTLSRYVDGIIVRTYAQKSLEEIAHYATVPVINALTDFLHPCQILADLFTIQEHFGTFQDVPIAYVGDGNNIANSWVMAAAHLGLELRLSCPEGYGPSKVLMNKAKERGYVPNVHTEPEAAVRGAKVVYTDVWVSMGQQSDVKKLRAFSGYQVDEKLLEKGASDVVAMHCLPAHRGEEISIEVFDKHSDLIFEQAENRLHVQKALLEKLVLS